MNIGTALGDAEGVVETVVPAARGYRLAIEIVLALVAIGAVAFIIWWVFIHPGQQRQAVTQAVTSGKLATSTADITAAAIPQINDATRQKVDVDITVQKGQIDVRAAPDAGTNIRGVSDGVLRNLCVQRAYAADPACQPLHEDTSVVGPAGRDGTGARQPD